MQKSWLIWRFATPALLWKKKRGISERLVQNIQIWTLSFIDSFGLLRVKNRIQETTHHENSNLLESRSAAPSTTMKSVCCTRLWPSSFCWSASSAKKIRKSTVVSVTCWEFSVATTKKIKKTKINMLHEKGCPLEEEDFIWKESFSGSIYLLVNFSVVYGELMLDWCTGCDGFINPQNGFPFTKDLQSPSLSST